MALATERYIHWLLHDRHIQGEWFDAPRAEIMAAIEKALTVGVDPEYPMPRIDLIGTGMGSGEHIATKFPKGTKARIAGLLADGEGRSCFIREAVERELDRREKDKP